MVRLETKIEINASAERVWAVLMAFPAYERWNPFIRSIEGGPIVGERLKVLIEPPGGKALRFEPRVLVVEPEIEFRWQGRVLFPGLFDGQHYFVLEKLAEKKVLLHHGERFSGLLLPFLKSAIEGPTRQGFIAMNEALRHEAEHGAN